MELREDSETEKGTKVFFSGHQYLITAERMQILDLLLSTYENAYHQNRELLNMQNKLRESNERLEEEKAKTESIIAAIGDGISIQDRDLKIVYQNEMLISYFGDHRGEKCHQAYNESGTPCVPCPVLASFEDGIIRTTEMIRPTKKGIASFEVTTSPLRDAAGDIIACIEVVRNVDQRKKLEEERENLIHDLQEALANIKTMSGLIPICAGCKKIRVDSGFWQQIEAYISDHSEAVFSHGICPECAIKLYPEIFGDPDKK